MHMQKNSIYLIPNLITYARLLSIPFIIIFYLSGIYTLQLLAFIIFILASISDFLDGYLARKLNQTSILGKILDPIADKLLVILVFMMFINSDLLNIFTSIGILIITAREIIVMTMREITAHQGIMIDVIKLSKLKTTLQFISLAMLFLVSLTRNSNLQILNLTNSFILLTAIVSLISLIMYVKTVYRSITRKKSNET
ncbi:MAG: CDP-diacylglycerol--glycerol-3-phosphate 3-phosphatidyltransferase [Rhodobiaceae bacterium]|nr:CDP-diacylglycerol--glycerol-3-phosphate 3-phosphatidyltransferase [Rhodobiaceae bacterium]MAU57762.1 CDP-diacylglycerol--glycerol-3-phosphate 3-phosphatidyltransferase [Rhodobiaceae bacterium]OUT81802.1 MAG: CDP-diacylglycerol--glycerol-3-phosphate 3-phosphatidyltransferase [Rhizobiales bacterium TMED28]